MGNLTGLCINLLVILCSFEKCHSNEHSAVLLAKAGQDVAFQPLVNEHNGRNGSSTSSFAEPARFDDLATTRIQVRTNDIVDRLWKNINNAQRFAILKEKGAAKEVIKLFRLLRKDILELDKKITTAKVENTLKTLTSSDHNWRKTWESVQKLTGKIKLLYSYLDGYMSNPDQVSQIALEDYARSILQPGSSQDTSMPTTLALLNNAAIPHPMSATDEQDRTDVMYKLFQTLTAKDGIYLCNVGQSTHQMIYNLYNMIALTEVKGYAMIQFSYMILRIYNKGNFTLKSDLARKRFEQQATEKLIAIKAILPNISKLYWRCDPNTPIEGVTFVQLTKLLQGHMENEVDMNDQKTCRHNCAKYDVAEPKNCYKNLQCAKQEGCKIQTATGLKPGRLFDCQFYHADAWVCMSQEQSRRKYDWIEYEDGRILGKKDQCENKIKVDSWWRWLFFHCSYCLCKCDAPGPNSDRYWSLKPATSNVMKNFIVTGIRLVKKSRVIHLEVQQAKALPEGAIDEASRVWMESSVIKIDENYLDASRDESTGIGLTSRHPHKEYFMMNYEKRSIDIDRLDAPSNHVITGVRFRNLGGHLNLEARVTAIKFREGTLLPDNSVWIGNDNTPATTMIRQPFFLLAPDIPTRFKGLSVIDTTTNQYLAFDTTSPEKDVMQTTVPFIDVQDVAPKTGTWLSGIGIYHKGKLGYGGYIGLSVQTFDFSRHMLPDLTSAYMSQSLKYDYQAESNNI